MLFAGHLSDVGSVAEENPEKLEAAVIRTIKLPAGYHEGILVDKDRVYVNNGENGKTWLIDINSGEKLADIEPVGEFTEGISLYYADKYWVSDWRRKSLYIVNISDNAMREEKKIYLGPSFVAGSVWTGENVYVLLWDSSFEGKYELLRVDREGRIIGTHEIKDIKEPSQMAWDGRYLWITSWCDGNVYKFDPQILSVVAYFKTPVPDATGIFYDGKHFWVTGTRSDLYQLSVE